MKNKRIIFMGTPDYATNILKSLLENEYNVVALFTQPDKKVGRKQLLTPPHIKQYCIDEGLSLPIIQPITLKSDLITEDIKNYKPDYIIVAAYGQILPKSILDIAPCINLHASLLPKYRGASPIQQAILNSDRYTGVTSMLMEEGLDSGDILGLKYVEITDDMDISDLFNKLANEASVLTLETLEMFNQIVPKKQNNTKVSHCGKIIKSDGLINFDNSKDIYQKYKAYKYWPGIFLESGLKIKECNLVDVAARYNCGEIIDKDNDSIVVGCNVGSLRITKVQPPSKKEMNVIDYIRGARLDLGHYLS